MNDVIEASIVDLYNNTRMLYLGIAITINNTYKTKFTSFDVHEVVKKHKLKFKTFTNLTEEEKDEIVDKYVNQKIDPRVLGIPYGVGKNHIAKVLRERKVMRDIGESNKKYSTENEDKILNLYKKGSSIKDICDELKLNYGNIQYVISKYNIERRSPKKYTVDESYFEKIDTQNKAYIFGLLMADGCNFRKTNNVSVKLELQEKDKDILIKIKDELKFSGVLYFKNLSIKNENTQNSWTLSLYSKKISDDLYKLGMLDNKSLTKTFPTCIPDELLSHFVRGYFDGNGSITLRATTNLPTTSITSNKAMIDKFYDIYNSLGVVSNKSVKINVMDLFVYGHENNRKIRDYIYKDAKLYIERKHTKFYMFK